jgi:hypothetical protein
MAHTYNPSYVENWVGKLESEASLGKGHESLSKKQTKKQKDQGMDQAVEHIPSKHDDLHLILSTAKKQKRKR